LNKADSRSRTTMAVRIKAISSDMTFSLPRRRCPGFWQ
jgi:hypothetical protein